MLICKAHLETIPLQLRLLKMSIWLLTTQRMLSAHREFLEQVNPAQPILIAFSDRLSAVWISGNTSYMTRKTNDLGGKMQLSDDNIGLVCGSDQFTERTLMHWRLPDPTTQNPSPWGEQWEAQCCSLMEAPETPFPRSKQVSF